MDVEKAHRQLDEQRDPYEDMEQPMSAYHPPQQQQQNENAHAHTTYPEKPDYKTDFTKDENEERGNWSGRLDFLLACLGYAVGLGNVWRFPYLAYRNGGAVFFIPYIIMLVFVGIPIFFLELSLGQFTSSGPLTCWTCVPFFRGIGLAMMLVSAFVGIYYNMIIAWAIWYLFASFTSELPWTTCQAPWATEYCEDYLWSNITRVELCKGDLHIDPAKPGVCFNATNHTIAIYDRALAKANDTKVHLAAEDFLDGRVWGLDNSDGIGDLGPLRWEMVLCYLLAWIIVCASLIKGVKSSGKVVYFTALFPYVVLIILLVRGLTLNNYFEGVRFYILDVDLDRIKDSAVWRDAAVQIFFSLSDSWGGLIALASYNRFHNNALRDSLIVSIGNCLTSFFAGFVIFSFLGFLAGELGVEVADVATSGVGLAFTVYPSAVTRMPVPQLWAILFFLMLITLGLDSEFALLETVTTCIFDQFPKTRTKKWAVILVTSCLFFLLGLPLCTEGGAYFLQLLDHYAGNWNVLIIAMCECLAIGYVYGFFRFTQDIELMIGRSPCFCLPWSVCKYWWLLTWCCLTPAGVFFILINSWVDYNEVTYGSYVYPSWAAAIGWLMSITVVLAIVLTMVVSLVVYALSPTKKIADLFRPNRYWGPALPKHRRLMSIYLHPSEFEEDPFGSRSTSYEPYRAQQTGADNAGYEFDGMQQSRF